MKKAAIIGSGFAGLSAACFLARQGIEVTVLEKNEVPGGRARILQEQGFSFDMGPSWYWMPDVLEHFFAAFGKKPSDYYDLVRLDPSYQVIWKDDTMQVPAAYPQLRQLFESIEQGASLKLDMFLEEAEYKYRVSMDKLIYKPCLSISEFMNWDILSSTLRLDIFSSMKKHLGKYFSHPKLLQLTGFPILFLGALPQNTPALYSLMNYADMKLGTWYPMGGMWQVVQAMYDLARSLGVRFNFNEQVYGLRIEDDKVTAVSTGIQTYPADVVIAACDYHHAEQYLLPVQYRNYDKDYWEKRNMSPSCLLYYVGLNKKITGLQHHNLFFDADFDAHAESLYGKASWPEDPLIYVCCPSLTDSTVAPHGCENVFILIPVPPGMEDNPTLRERYFDIAIDRIESKTKQALRHAIIYKRSYAHNDFVRDYNSFKGNAYGMANTLRQTAVMKPSIRNKKLKNFWYTGQLTIPGPGVPPAIISGRIVANEIVNTLTKKTEKAI